MNILKNIKINGEVFLEYAFLSYVISFKSQNEDVSPEYIFSLPEDAQISSFKIYLNGKMINSKVISAAHASMLLSGNDAYAVLKKVNKFEYILTLGCLSDGKCDVLLTVYVPVNKNRMVLPLTKGVYGGRISQHTVSVRLNVIDGNNAEISSPTHDVFINNKSDGSTEVSAESIAANRDFCLDIKGREKRNSAILVENANGGEMLCRVCLRELNYVKPKKLLLIYDSECNFSKGESQLARSFIYYAAKSFGGYFAVMSANRFLTDGFVEGNDENIDKLLINLSNIDTYVDSTANFLKNDDVFAVCVTNSENIKRKNGMYYVSVGNIRTLSDEHIYPNDNISERANDVIKYFIKQIAVKNIRAVANSAETSVISVSEGGSVTVYVRYVGICPKTIELILGENRMTENLSDISIYKSYSPLGLVYADKEVKSLENKLLLCPIDDVPSIREKIEQMGVKYSSLNSETALAVRMGANNAVIKTVIPSSADRSFETDCNVSSIFRESQTILPSSLFIKKCISLITQSLRADGSICVDGEVDYSMKIKQTEICVMALIAAEVKIDNKTLMRIKNFLRKDIKTDSKSAKMFLTKVFDKPSYIPENTKPDLMTAARAVWQSVEF